MFRVTVAHEMPVNSADQLVIGVAQLILDIFLGFSEL